jgi:hypothetical protein
MTYPIPVPIRDTRSRCLNGETPRHYARYYIGDTPDHRGGFDPVYVNVAVEQETRAYRWHGDPTVKELHGCLSLSMTYDTRDGGGAGVPQIVKDITRITTYHGVVSPSGKIGSPSHDTRPLTDGERATLARMGEIADRWHLNTVIAPCVHLRPRWEEAHRTTKYPAQVPLETCPECSYRCGSVWTAESLPDDVIATIAGWAGLATIEHTAPYLADAPYLYPYGPPVPPLTPPAPPAPIEIWRTSTARESYEHSDSTRITVWRSPYHVRCATFKTTTRGLFSLHLATIDDPDRLTNGQVLYKLDLDDAARFAEMWIKSPANKQVYATPGYEEMLRDAQ